MKELEQLEKLRREYQKFLKERAAGKSAMTPVISHFSGFEKRMAEQIIDEEEKKWAKSLRR